MRTHLAVLVALPALGLSLLAQTSGAPPAAYKSSADIASELAKAVAKDPAAGAAIQVAPGISVRRRSSGGEPQYAIVHPFSMEILLHRGRLGLARDRRDAGSATAAAGGSRHRQEHEHQGWRDSQGRQGRCGRHAPGHSALVQLDRRYGDLPREPGKGAGATGSRGNRRPEFRRGDPGRAAVGQDRRRVRVPRHAGPDLPAAAERRRKHHGQSAGLRHQARQRAGARHLVRGSGEGLRQSLLRRRQAPLVLGVDDERRDHPLRHDLSLQLRGADRRRSAEARPRSRRTSSTSSSPTPMATTSAAPRCCRRGTAPAS